MYDILWYARLEANVAGRPHLDPDEFRKKKENHKSKN